MSFVYMSMLRWVRCRNRCISKALFEYLFVYWGFRAHRLQRSFCAHSVGACSLLFKVEHAIHHCTCTCCAVSKTGVSVEPVYTAVLLLLVFYCYFSLRGRRITLRKWNGCPRQCTHTYIRVTSQVPSPMNFFVGAPAGGWHTCPFDSCEYRQRR